MDAVHAIMTGANLFGFPESGIDFGGGLHIILIGRLGDSAQCIAC